MDKRELLKSVLQNFINDKPDEAKADFHQYLTLKSKEVTGIGVPTATQETADTQTTDQVTPPADATPPVETPPGEGAVVPPTEGAE